MYGQLVCVGKQGFYILAARSLRLLVRITEGNQRGDFLILRNVQILLQLAAVEDTHDDGAETVVMCGQA